MSILKTSILWGLAGAVILFVTFSINFWIAEGSLPGYKVLVYPGILATRPFSEEVAFWPKLSIMLAGQFLTFFTVSFVINKLNRKFKQRKAR